MTEDIKVQAAGATDKAKLWVAILLVLAGVAGFYVLSDQNVWLRWGVVIVGLLLAAALIAFSSYGTGLKQFFVDSRVELRKIVWPNRNETGTTTLVVFVFVLAAGVFFWVLDWLLALATRSLTGQGG